MGGKLGIKQCIFEAALYRYFSLGPHEREELVKIVLASQTTGGAQKLVKDAEIKAKTRATHHGSDVDPADLADAAQRAIDVDQPPKNRRRTGTDR
jgi:hypothetical protein